jgi:hypothetical protein
LSIYPCIPAAPGPAPRTCLRLGPKTLSDICRFSWEGKGRHEDVEPCKPKIAHTTVDTVTALLHVSDLFQCVVPDAVRRISITVFAHAKIRNRNTLVLSDLHSSELLHSPLSPKRVFCFPLPSFLPWSLFPHFPTLLLPPLAFLGVWTVVGHVLIHTSLGPMV